MNLCFWNFQPIAVKIFYPEQHHSDIRWNELKKLCNNYWFKSLKKWLNSKCIVCTSPRYDCNWLFLKFFSDTKKKQDLSLDGAIINAHLNSLTLYRWQFKMWVVFLSDAIFIWLFFSYFLFIFREVLNLIIFEIITIYLIYYQCIKKRLV